MIITNSLGSNYSGEDIRLSLSLLFQPWRWKNGKETRLLKNEIATGRTGQYIPRNDVSVRLFYKGRQAIGEALRILKNGAGDEVIVQAFTCVAVVQPILEAGAIPVYVDVAPKSLNPPLSFITQRVTARTRAVILQHTLGVVNPETRKIVDWCKDHKIFVIQDLAHAFGAPGFKNVFKDSPPDRIPEGESLGILSFSQDKVVDGVSGGALVIARSPRRGNLDLKTDRHGRQGGLAMTNIIKMLLYPTFTHLIRSTYQYKFGKLLHFIVRELNLLPVAIEVSDTGQYPPLSPFPMPNACAVLALRQLERIDEIAAHRKDIALLYEKVLRSDFKIVSKSDVLSGSNLRYPIWVNNRGELEEKLKKHNFYLLDHWYDTVISPPRVKAETLYYRKGSCPNAEELSKHIFNLPTHTNISIEKATKLAELVNATS